MLTLLGTLLGLLSSALPEAVRLYKDRQDKKHELAILKMQMERDAKEHEYRLEEIDAEADIAEAKLIHAPQKAIGIYAVDLLNGIVRPVVTLAFFALYCGIKWAQYDLAMRAGADMTMAEALTVIWHEEDKALFAAILAYWFGQRSMKWAMGRIAR